MEYRLLGKSDLNVSRIGFGGMSIDPTDINAERMLNEALDSGINFFDTADIYSHGTNEVIFGRAFKAKRDRVIIATKVGNRHNADGSGLEWIPSKKYILEAVDKSLKRLQTDYIDLYQLHGGTLDDPMDEMIEAFELLMACGKIRYYGISSIRPNVIREYIRRSSIVSVMMQYSLLDRRPEEEMLPLLMENHIGVLARGSIAKGLLVSKQPAPYLNYSVEQVAEIAYEIKQIPGYKINAISTALYYVLARPEVCSAIVGIRTTKQLEEIQDIYFTNKLTETERSNLGRFLDVNFYEANR